MCAFLFGNTNKKSQYLLKPTTIKVLPSPTPTIYFPVFQEKVSRISTYKHLQLAQETATRMLQNISLTVTNFKYFYSRVPYV